MEKLQFGQKKFRLLDVYYWPKYLNYYDKDTLEVAYEKLDNWSLCQLYQRFYRLLYHASSNGYVPGRIF